MENSNEGKTNTVAELPKINLSEEQRQIPETNGQQSSQITAEPDTSVSTNKKTAGENGGDLIINVSLKETPSNSSSEGGEVAADASLALLLNSSAEMGEMQLGSNPESLSDQLAVVQRLGQIKEYKRQVLMMMNQMKNESPEVDKDLLRKLLAAYDNFKLQEEQYLEVLQMILVSKQNLAMSVLDGTTINGPAAPGTAVRAVDESSVPSSVVNSDILQTMQRQQEDLRALQGHITASRKSRDELFATGKTKSEEDLLHAQKSVEDQGALLTAKRKQLEAIRERLGQLNTLSSCTASEAERVEDELDHRTTVECKLKALSDKKQLMDEILNTMDDREQNPEEETADAGQLPGQQETRNNETNMPNDTKTMLDKKYNELLATKKRIAEIQSMMSSLEANYSAALATNEQHPPVGAKLNNQLTDVGSSGRDVKVRGDKFNAAIERRNLAEVKRRLVSMNNSDLERELSETALIHQLQNPTFDQRSAEVAGASSNCGQQQLNIVKNNLVDLVPCRLSKSTLLRRKASNKQSDSRLRNGNDEPDDLTECEDYEEEEEDEDDEVPGATAATFNLNQSSSGAKNSEHVALAAFPARASLTLTGSSDKISKNPRLPSFRRNNNISSTANHVSNVSNTGVGMLPNNSCNLNRKSNVDNSSNARQNNNLAMAAYQNSYENVQGSMTSSTDSRYEQLTQHIESIRSIFDSVMNHHNTQQPQQQQHQQQPFAMPGPGNVMTSSFPGPIRYQSSLGHSDSLGPGHVLSSSLVCLPQQLHHQQQQMQQNQELMMSLIKCQQQLQTQQSELKRLHEIYANLEGLYLNSQRQSLSENVDNCNTTMPKVRSRRPHQSLDSSRPLSRNSLYNLFAPNPYLMMTDQQRSALQAEQDTCFGKVSSAGNRMRRASYLNERMSSQNNSSAVGVGYDEKPTKSVNSRGKNYCSSFAASRSMSDLAACQQQPPGNNNENIYSQPGARNGKNHVDNSSDHDDDGPFDSLRESIYSEVATFISQNEQRPHYLLELFRELQLLSSDHLRERAFQAIHDILDRYLIDETENANGILTRVQKLVDHQPSSISRNGSFSTSIDTNGGAIRKTFEPFSNAYKGNQQNLNKKNSINSTPEQRRSRERPKKHQTSKSSSKWSEVESLANTFSSTAGQPCKDLESQIGKIQDDLLAFLNQNESANATVYDETFVNLLRKFCLSMVILSNILPYSEPGSKFFYKRLNDSLKVCLGRFVNAKFPQHHKDVCKTVVDMIREQLSFFYLVQNIDAALDGDNGKHITAGRIRGVSSNIARSESDQSRLIQGVVPPLGADLRSPSEISECLKYKDEFQTMDHALAYIDDEFKAIENEESTSNSRTEFD